MYGGFLPLLVTAIAPAPPGSSSSLVHLRFACWRRLVDLIAGKDEDEAIGKVPRFWMSAAEASSYFAAMLSGKWSETAQQPVKVRHG